MATEKFTPGPWKTHLVNSCLIVDPNGDVIAEALGDYRHPEKWPVMEADARLIAASPTMFEALQEARVQVAILQERLGIVDPGAGTLSIIDAALKQARGQ